MAVLGQAIAASNASPCQKATYGRVTQMVMSRMPVKVAAAFAANLGETRFLANLDEVTDECKKSGGKVREGRTVAGFVDFGPLKKGGKSSLTLDGRFEAESVARNKSDQ